MTLRDPLHTYTSLGLQWKHALDNINVAYTRMCNYHLTQATGQQLTSGHMLI